VYKYSEDNTQSSSHEHFLHSEESSDNESESEHDAGYGDSSPVHSHHDDDIAYQEEQLPAIPESDDEQDPQVIPEFDVSGIPHPDHSDHAATTTTTNPDSAQKEIEFKQTVSRISEFVRGVEETDNLDLTPEERRTIDDIAKDQAKLLKKSFSELISQVDEDIKAKVYREFDFSTLLQGKITTEQQPHQPTSSFRGFAPTRTLARSPVASATLPRPQLHPEPLPSTSTTLPRTSARILHPASPEVAPTDSAGFRPGRTLARTPPGPSTSTPRRSGVLDDLDQLIFGPRHATRQSGPVEDVPLPPRPAEYKKKK